MFPRFIAIVVCVAAGTAAPGTEAQRPGVDAGNTVYRLTDAADFQEGCFDPCLCPLTAPAKVRGTFVLGPPVAGNVVDFRDITDLSWTVGDAGVPLHTITGTGNYRVTNYAPERQHALELYLSIDGGPPEFFSSDFAPLTSADGSIDLRVSMYGLVCYDRAIRVTAAPVPTAEIVPYHVARGSTLMHACFDPCNCTIDNTQALRGSFGLVELLNYGTYAEYAIVGARLGAGSGPTDPRTRRLRGFGTYTLIQGFAGPAHAMTLTLRGGLHDTTVFSSGLTNTGPIFPVIAIDAVTGDQECFDSVLTLRARPPAHVLPMPVSQVPGPTAH